MELNVQVWTWMHTLKNHLIQNNQTWTETNESCVLPRYVKLMMVALSTCSSFESTSVYSGKMSLMKYLFSCISMQRWCFSLHNDSNVSLYLVIFNFWRTSVGPLIPLLDFQWCLAFRWIPHLPASSPTCNGFLTFTSSATPAYLLMASMEAEPFYSYTCVPVCKHWWDLNPW